ncbi:MAG: flagellar biosynthesis anti-sigma factor FlgM [Bacillota bacterium]|uniref:flagellar biosynthesis anti-sigma factor FlgM n=1 Tax=Desulfurispora thermophila TaxID=265470 RepID=UPI00035C3421|nr:flagellar biosynthesis anti-sigma factor FlgM [Desulfurispora thermophila]
MSAFSGVRAKGEMAMKITPYNGMAELVRLYKDKAGKSGINEYNHVPAGEQADRADISTRGKALAAFKTALREVPAVRQELVDRLREQIAAGTYNFDYQAIAKGIKEELLD